MTDINKPSLPCPRCRVPLPVQAFNTPSPGECPSCKRPVYAAVFPSFLRGPEKGRIGDAILTDGEAGCFHHAGKKAVAACEICGRFLCALCDVEIAGQHLCPACVENGMKQKKLKALDAERVLYDKIAFILALCPLIVTAPMALFMAVRCWNAPLSLVRRSRAWFVFAVLLAILQLAGWGTLFLWLRKG